MAVCYGNAIRDYAFAVSSGRLTSGQIDQTYLARCINVITNCGNDLLGWSQSNAYGTSFPDLSKAYRSGGWYFPSEQAFDLAVAYQFNPSPQYLEAVVHNMNYEAGCNPVNVSFVTGLGWKRPRTVIDLYSLNDQRILPKDGVPIGNIVTGFEPVWTYQWERLDGRLDHRYDPLLWRGGLARGAHGSGRSTMALHYCGAHHATWRYPAWAAGDSHALGGRYEPERGANSVGSSGPGTRVWRHELHVRSRTAANELLG
jgi:hypothetical protein